MSCFPFRDRCQSPGDNCGRTSSYSVAHRAEDPNEDLQEEHICRHCGCCFLDPGTICPSSNICGRQENACLSL